MAAACALSGANAQTFNPTSSALGFNVFTTGNMTVVGGDTHGPVAIGGDLLLQGNAPLAMNTSGSYPTGALNNAGNYGLVINGRVFYNSGGAPTYVNQGLIRLGNTAGTALFDQDNNGANTDLQLTSGALNSNPRVQKQNGWQNKNTATSGHGINFSTATIHIAQASAIINSYATTNCQNKINLIIPPSCTNCNPTISPVANKVNLVNITTAAQLATLLNSGSLTISPAPTATSPLIFNVTISGSIAWAVPNMAGVGGSHGQYILWNFPNATGINFANNNSVYGTILAPQAAVVKDGGNNFEGQVLSASLSLNTGEIHYQPFAAQLPQCSTALALEIVSLVASRVGSEVRLSCSVESTNNAILNLERSNDGVLWTTIAEGLTENSVVDRTAPSTKVSYRLKALFADGRAAYSPITTVEALGRVSTPTVVPNPFTETIVAFNVWDHSSASLLDVSGRVLATLVPKGGAVRFDGLDELPAGVYFIRLTTAAGASTVHKIVKQ